MLQEILHRYHAIQRYDAIQPALDVLLAVVDEVVPIERDTVLRAREILLAQHGLSARDAVHVATMEAVGAEQIMTFDHGFDRMPGTTRLS